MANFSAHCDYSITVNENLLISTMKGAWNEEGTRLYINEVKAEVQKICHQPWGRIADISQFEGGAQVVMDQLEHLQQWSIENHCQFLFLINPAALNRMVIEARQEQKTYLAVEIFTSIEQAIEAAMIRLSALVKTA